MAHAVLAVNPFDVLLRLHQKGSRLEPGFSTWLRSFGAPPIRTTAALIEHCPRVDWLFWYFEQCVHLELIQPEILLVAGPAVRRQLEMIASGRTYSADRGEHMPHAEGLAVLREVLHRTLFE